MGDGPLQRPYGTILMPTFREKLERLASTPFDQLPEGEQPGAGFSGSPRKSYLGTAAVLSPEDFETLREAASKLLMDNPE